MAGETHFFPAQGPLVPQPRPVRRTCSEVEFGWGRTFSSGRQERCQRSLLASCTYGPLVTATHLGRRGTEQKLRQGCADGRGDRRPRTEHQNHGHRTRSCCSRLALPTPCLTPTQAQMEGKEHLRKSAFSNSEIRFAHGCARISGDQENQTPTPGRSSPSHKMSGAGCPPQFEKTREKATPNSCLQGGAMQARPPHSEGLCAVPGVAS